MPTTPETGELADVVAFIADQQRHPERNIVYLGTELQGVTAELEGLDPPWTTTVRIARAGDRIVGAVAVEWDEEVGRSWVMGPWAAHDDERWLAVAEELLDAVLDQVPAAITRHEMSGDTANQRLAQLAAARGWWTTEVNHALSVDEDTVATWPAADAGPSTFRAATPDDVEGIRVLHDAEFPATYATADQLVQGQRDGSRTTLVAEDGTGGLAAYASGHVQEDGEGCLDFVVVRPDHHGRGLGKQVLAAIARDLLPRSPQRRMALTVQDHRAPARALYERLGFRHEVSFVGYRSWEQ